MESPLVRGGLTLVAGVLTGNVLGFVRVALIAYLLGTHSRADSLAVAMGPLDTLNSVLINSIVFAFVPMLTACRGAERTALFLKLSRCFAWVFAAISRSRDPGRALADARAGARPRPALFRHGRHQPADPLRSPRWPPASPPCTAPCCTPTAASRPAAFYQAALNVFTIAGALGLWKFVGVYAFAIGYTAGAWAQLAIVYLRARAGIWTPAARSAVPRALARDSGQAGVFRGLRRRTRSEHHLHPRLRHPRRAGNGGGAGLLHARRRRAAGAAGDSDFQFAAAGNRPLAQRCSGCAKPSA